MAKNACFWMGTNYPDFFFGVPDLSLADDETENLVKAIGEGFKGQDLRAVHNLIVKGLFLGCQQLRWNLNPPSLLRSLQLEGSAITQKTQKLCQRYNELQRLFWQDLEDAESQRCVGENITLAAGQLLFSFVMNSGCLSNSVIKLLPEAINSGVWVFGDQYWLDCEQARQAKDESARFDDANARLSLLSSRSKLVRRIFPAPVTGLLLYRFYKKYSRHWPQKTVGQLVGDYLNHLEPGNNHGRKPQQRLIELGRAKAAVALPGVLRTYAENVGLSPPISAVNMIRWLTNTPWQCSLEQPDTTRSVMPVEHKAITRKTACEDLRVSLSRLRAKLRAPDNRATQEAIKSRRGVKSYLEEHDYLHPLIEFLAHWAAHLLSYGNCLKGPLKSSSTLDYISTVSNALLPYATELMDPSNLDGEQWEALYEKALDNSSAAKHQVAVRLGYFHNFLEAAYGFPEVDIDGAEEEGEIEAAVITPAEYARALEALTGTRTDELSRLCCVALILGYRCGLRRNEALGVQLWDFSGFEEGVDRVELFVQRNGLRGLKSFSATRRLPLWLLLTPDESTLVRATVERRKAQCSGDVKRPLFNIPGVTRRVLIEQMVMGPVTRILRDVAGDPTARFHHLRHSFASLTFLRMLEWSPLELVPSIWQTDFWSRQTPSAEILMWASAGLADTMSGIYLLSMWMGHSSPSVTMQTYAHLADWMLARRLANECEVALTPRLQTNITGMPHDAAEKHNYRAEINQPTPLQLLKSMGSLWRRVPQRKLEAKPIKQDATPPNPYRENKTKVHWLLPYQVERLLTEKRERRGTDKYLCESVADIMGLRPGQVLQIHMNAERIAGWSYEGRERAKGQILSRFFTRHEAPKRALGEKHTHKGEPQLACFVAPPRSRLVRGYAERFTDALFKWHADHSALALTVLIEHLKASQRTHSRVRHRREAKKINQIALLKAIGARSWLRIRVTVREEHALTDVDLKKHYVNRFGVLSRHVYLERQADRQGRYDGSCGVWQIEVEPPEELLVRRSGQSETQQRFWEALRFAVFSVTVYLMPLSRAEPEQVEYNLEF